MKKLLPLLLLLTGCFCKKEFISPAEDTFKKVAINDDIDGYDLLMLPKYCDKYLKAPHLPGLSTSFVAGNPLPCIDRKMAKNQLELVQVDLVDATCWRNNVCPPGSPKPPAFKEIYEKSLLVYEKAKRWNASRWQISPWLEHDFKDPEVVHKGMSEAKRGCPICEVINSPYKGVTPAAYNVERHGTKTKAYSISGDGASSFDADNLDSTGTLNNAPFNHSNAGSNSTFGWWNETNLRCTGEEKFTPINKRTERPEQWQFRLWYLLTLPEEPKPAAPKLCKTVREVSGGEIVKITAESYCNGQPGENDPRNNKPLLIIKKKGRRGEQIYIYNPQGKKAGSFGYYGEFTDKRFGRWYSGLGSKHNAPALYDALGGEWGYVNLGSGNCLRINVIRRMGTWR